MLALTLMDDADDPVLEPGVGETPLWPMIRVTALFDADTPVEPISRLLCLVPGIDRPQQVSFRTIEDQQWERVWLDRFQPMRFGRDLWVVPGDQAIPPQAVHVLRLDPGLAFGTGHHPTTRLCLQWMDGHDFTTQEVVDFGCGSGVLGIVAALKGASRVQCVDNDPQALTATRDNAARNGVADLVETLSPDDHTPGNAGVVLANILAAPLIELAPLLTASLGAGGWLVLSGILEAQADEVMSAYRPYMAELSCTTDEGWVRIDGRKPA